MPNSMHGSHKKRWYVHAATNPRFAWIPSAARIDYAAADREEEGRRKEPVVKQLHLIMTVLLLGAVLTLVVLVAVGEVEIGFVRAPPPAPVAPPPAPVAKAPAGPRIYPAHEAEKYYELLGYKGVVFKYDGGWIDGWIEVDVDGKKTVIEEALGKGVKQLGQGRAGDQPSGYLYWVRRTENNKEVWDLGLNVVASDGGERAFSRAIGISPPPLDMPKPGGADVWGGSGGGPLTAGKEIQLYEVSTSAPNEGQGSTTRRAKLMCKLAK
jgi:hypothetical protein